MQVRTHDYVLDLEADDDVLVVRLKGRVTRDAGRQLREVVRAADDCGIPVLVELPRVSGEAVR